MGRLDDYEAAVGLTKAPQEPAKKRSRIEEYEAAVPTRTTEAIQQFGSKLGRGAAGTLAYGIQSVGLGLERMSQQPPSPEPTDPNDLAGAIMHDVTAQAQSRQRKVGKAIQGYAETIKKVSTEALPEVERLRDSFVLSTVPEALGSAGAFMAGGAALKALGIPVWMSTMSQGAAVQSAAQFEDARLNGASEEDQWKAWALGAAVGTSEAFGIGQILARANKASGGTLAKALIHGIVEGFEEMTQEGVSQFASNLIATDLLKYDKDRKWMEGVVNAAGAGAASGLLFSALASTHAHGKPAREQAKRAKEFQRRKGPSESQAGAIASQFNEKTGVPVNAQPPEPGAKPPAAAGKKPPPAETTLTGLKGGPATTETTESGQAVVPENQPEPTGHVQEPGSVGPKTQAAPPAASAPAEAEETGKAAPTQPEEAAKPSPEGPKALVYAHTQDLDPKAVFPEGSKVGPVETRPIASLRRRQNERMRNPISEEVVAEFQRKFDAGEPVDPVVLLKKPNGEEEVLEGHNRIAAAEAMGFEDVPVRVVEIGERRTEAKPAGQEFFSEDRYSEAAAHAQELADRLGVNVRLKAVNEYGKKGYRSRLVPSEENQYGRDLEGELYRPTSKKPVEEGRRIEDVHASLRELTIAQEPEARKAALKEDDEAFGQVLHRAEQVALKREGEDTPEDKILREIVREMRGTTDDPEESAASARRVQGLLKRAQGLLSGERPAAQQAPAPTTAPQAGPAGAAPQPAAAAAPAPTREEDDPARLERAEKRHERALRDLAELGPEPPKPSSEKKRFGEKGRAGATPEARAAFDEEVARHRAWKRKYAELKKLEVAYAHAVAHWRRATEADQAATEELGYPVEVKPVANDEAQDGDGQITAPEVPGYMRTPRPPDPITGETVILGRSPPGTSLVPTTPPAPTKGRRVSAPQVIHALSRIIAAADGKTPIRWGRIKGTALGVFKVGPEVIRVREANDIPVATHEVAHALEKHIFGFPKGGPWRKPLVGKKIQKELRDLGYALYGKRIPAGGYKREGFAEFVRLYVTDPAAAQKAAPLFHQWFEGTFLKDRPAIQKEVLASRDLAQRWYGQGPKKRGKASIVYPASIPSRTKRGALTLRRVLSRKAWFDAGAPLNELAREAERRLGRLLAPSQDPYALRVGLNLTHSARTRWMVEREMIDLAGNPVGPSLADAVALVKGRYEDFTLYLWARRTLALWNDPASPHQRGSGLAPEDAEVLLAMLDSPAFALAAGKVYDFQDGVLNYAAQASPTLAAVVDQIRARDPGDYIPLQREFDELDSLWGEMKRARGLGTGGSITQRLRGSGRRIKNPFPVIISNTERVLLAAHRRAVLDAAMRLAAIPGMGKLVEEVPVNQLPAASAKIADLIKKLEKYGLEVAGPGGVQLAEDDDVLGEIITFFAPAQFPMGQDPVIPVWDGAARKLRWYYVDHRLAETLAGMDVYRLPQWAELSFGTFTKITRAGTTGLRASFGLVINPLRDPQTFYTQTRSKALGPELFFEWLKAMTTSGLSAVTGGRVSNPYRDAWLRLGGEMTLSLAQDSSQSARAARRLFQGMPVRLVDPRNQLDFVRDLLQFPESAPRVAEFKLVAKEIGWTPGRPMTLDQSLQFITAASEVTTDYRASGDLSRVTNRLAPFSNAGFQGPRAGWRAMRRAPGRFFFRGLQMSAATLALWWLNKDRDWYRELSARTKALYWAIPFQWKGREELALVPRAFETGAIFSALPELMADAWYREDPATARSWVDHFLTVFTPNMEPVLLDEAIDQWTNKDQFWDTPIVPRGELGRPAEEQYNEYTTRASVYLGSLFGASPRRIDHAIRGIGGGLAIDVIEAVGLGGPARKTGIAEPSDLPIIGRIFQRGGALGTRPASIQKIYDLLEQAQIKQASIKTTETKEERELRLMLMDATQAVSALTYVRSQADDIDKRRELMRESVEIARDALDAFKAGTPQRGYFQQIKKQAERRESEAKQ